jgi:hypothetical protein
MASRFELTHPSQVSSAAAKFLFCSSQCAKSNGEGGATRADVTSEEADDDLGAVSRPVFISESRTTARKKDIIGAGGISLIVISFFLTVAHCNRRRKGRVVMKGVIGPLLGLLLLLLLFLVVVVMVVSPE